MKIRSLFIAFAAALMVSACGKKENAPASTSEASAAATSSGAPTTTKAGPRVIEITANDQMKFSVATIEAKAGEELKIVLRNVGTMPKEAMGHNWVLLKPGSDVAAFGAAASAARTTDYIPDALKGQIVAHTKLLGPKGTDEITFTVPAAGEYPFLCSFPGHFALMKGTLVAK